MTGQLLPPKDLAPTVAEDTTPGQRIAIWLDLMSTGHKLLMAGLRHQVGPDGDVQAAYREWYRQQMDEHDRKLVRMLERMNRNNDAS